MNLSTLPTSSRHPLPVEMKITLQQVARSAEVSIGTASRVLRGDPTVTPDLSEKVLLCAERLGYRRLRRERGATSEHPLRGKTIGVMLLGMGPSLAASPLVGMALDGIRRGLTGQEALLQVLDVPDPANPPSTLALTRADAWLVKGSNVGNVWSVCHRSITDRLNRRPTVWFHGKPETAAGDCVGVDDLAVGRLAANALRDAGHCSVAFVTTRRNQRLLARREQGFKQRCAELGLSCRIAAAEVDEYSWPLEKPKDEGAMASLVDRMLKWKPHVTAVFVPADSLAVLLFQALSRRGMTPGKDLGIISANGEWPLVVGLNPGLATIDIGSDHIGFEAVRQLAGRYVGQPSPPPVYIALPPRMVHGESLPQLK